MDIFQLPLEIIERILLCLDVQDLAACAVADIQFAEIIYFNHFLDEYCRSCFNCSVLSVTDISSADVADLFEFWHLVYTSMKLEEMCQSNLFFSSEILTKLGTLKHMYTMWITYGLRSSFMYSHLLMYEFYPVPLRIKDTLRLLGQSIPTIVNDTLVKVFIAVPEIMDLSCGSLDHFSMQHGGTVSSHMDIVCNDGIEPRLPYNFTSLFTVEIILSRVQGRSPAILLLVGEDRWTFWMGYLAISLNITSIECILMCEHFSHADKIADIRGKAKDVINEIKNAVACERETTPCPIISYNNPDIVHLTISLTQQHHRNLQQKFDAILDATCANLVSTITSKLNNDSEAKEKIISVLNGKVSNNTQINNYILNLLKIDNKKVRKLSTQQHLSCLLYKSILEQIACLFRDYILQGNNENNIFVHSLLCGCLGYFSMAISSDVEEKIEKCMSEKLRDILYSPLMWPSHVLSAACNIIPSLSEVLRSDLHMITSRGGTKYVVPQSVQAQITSNLQKVGLCLTNRPPSKPRCPLILRQVRLWNFEYM